MPVPGFRIEVVDVLETVRCSFCMGVDGVINGRTGASESGGEGGVACKVETSEFASGGVDTVGEDTEVVEVAVSESGDGGRNASPSSWDGFLW